MIKPLLDKFSWNLLGRFELLETLIKRVCESVEQCFSYDRLLNGLEVGSIGQETGRMVAVAVAAITIIGFLPLGISAEANHAEGVLDDVPVPPVPIGGSALSAGELWENPQDHQLQRLQEFEDGCTPHPPIRVTENHGSHGFTWTNPATGDHEHRPGSGVTQGSGSKDDPFIIEGWCITSPTTTGFDDALPAVGLHGTDAHVEVRDTLINGASGYLDKGLYAFASSNITFAENVILHSYTGAYAFLAENIEIRDNTVLSSHHFGIGALGSEDVVVSNNTVEYTLHGEHVLGVGIYIQDTASPIVQNNDVRYTYSYGILVWRSTSPTITGNNVTNSLSSGVAFVQSPDATVTGNFAGNNEGTGIATWARTTGLLVADNIATGNTADGIDLVGAILSKSINATVENNTAKDNGGVGLRLSYIDGSELRNNTLERNIIGIEVDGSGPGVTGTLVEKNRMTENDRGLLIHSFSDETTVRDNVLVDNADKGVHVMDSNQLHVLHNTIEGSEWGLVLEEHRWNGGLEDAHITANHVANNSGGILFSGQNIGHVVKENNIYENNQVGLFVGGEYLVDARENWWGCQDGPSNSGCDWAIGEATFDPWLTAPNPNAGAR